MSAVCAIGRTCSTSFMRTTDQVSGPIRKQRMKLMPMRSVVSRRHKREFAHDTKLQIRPAGARHADSPLAAVDHSHGIYRVLWGSLVAQESLRCTRNTPQETAWPRCSPKSGENSSSPMEFL